MFPNSIGISPTDPGNPVDAVFADPLPDKRRPRMTLEPFKALYSIAPHWLQWLMPPAFDPALRRFDLVSLRFEDLAGDRIIRPIRNTDSQARGHCQASASLGWHVTADGRPRKPVESGSERR